MKTRVPHPQPTLQRWIQLTNLLSHSIRQVVPSNQEALGWGVVLPVEQHGGNVRAVGRRELLALPMGGVWDPQCGAAVGFHDDESVLPLWGSRVGFVVGFGALGLGGLLGGGLGAGGFGFLELPLFFDLGLAEEVLRGGS